MTYSITINFADHETPISAGGRMYLQNIPQPASLQLFKNGMLMSPLAGDYMLTGQVITPMPEPGEGDVFVAWYRY